MAVPTEFEEVFSHFYFAENDTTETIAKTLMPSYQTMMVFSFGSTISFATRQDTKIVIEKCLVIGPIKKAFDYSLPPDANILVVNFKDDAFFRFFGSAAIAEHTPLDPDQILHENCFEMLWHELKKINDHARIISHILEFCNQYLKDRNAIAKQIADHKGDGNLSPVKEIAEKNELTERAIQLHHKKQLGYSAKEINRYQRFLKAVKFVQAVASGSSKMDWVQVVTECGYYDQSQLIHDFKHYLHLSPTKYLKFQRDICG